MNPLNEEASAVSEGRCWVTTFVEMVFPDQANHYGTLYGGNALGILGKAAFVTATRFARRSVVMAASERVEFQTPVRLGQMLELTGRVVRVGRSSMTVEVEGVAETLPGGARMPALRGRFEMVAVDDAGRPRAILVEGEAPAALSGTQ
jgi:acyl-CoA hydrolase